VSLFSLIAPLALGCGAPGLSPDGGGARNNGDATGLVDVSSDVGSVMLNAVPPCGPGTQPSSLLASDSRQGFTQALLVDDTGIYLNAANLILRAPLAGGEATALSTMSIFDASSFARVDSFLWAAANWGVSGLLRLPIEGTAPSFAPAFEGIQNVAGALGRVFFTGFHDWVESYGSDLASGPTIELTGQGTLIAISRSLNDGRLRTILLTDRELEPYHIYEREQSRSVSRRGAGTAEALAQTTFEMYFQKL
jgi:hypothetical protein